jgi:hypothetical protein
MATPALTTLGGFAFKMNGVSTEGPATRKARALMAYPVMNRGADTARERLLEIFWPNSNPDRGRDSLVTALSSIAIGSQAYSAKPNGIQKMVFARSGPRSVSPNVTNSGFNQLIGVLCGSVAYHENGMLDGGNVGCCVAVNEQQIGLLSAFDTADAVKTMHRARAVGSRNLDGLHRRETGRNEQLDLPLIGESRDAASSCIGTFGKQSTLRNKGALECHLNLKDVTRYFHRQLIRTSFFVAVFGVVV